MVYSCKAGAIIDLFCFASPVFFAEATPTEEPTLDEINGAINRTSQFYTKIIDRTYSSTFTMLEIICKSYHLHLFCCTIFLLNSWYLHFHLCASVNNYTFTNGAEIPFKMSFATVLSFQNNGTGTVPTIEYVFALCHLPHCYIGLGYNSHGSPVFFYAPSEIIGVMDFGAPGNRNYDDYLRNYVWTQMGDYFYDAERVVYTAN